jgi:hypothetical protein
LPVAIIRHLWVDDCVVIDVTSGKDEQGDNQQTKRIENLFHAFYNLFLFLCVLLTDASNILSF